MFEGLPSPAELGEMLNDAMGDEVPDNCIIMAEISLEGDALVVRGVVMDMDGVGSPPLLGIPTLEDAMKGVVGKTTLDRLADDGGPIH
jgi:hypothetical protein